MSNFNYDDYPEILNAEEVAKILRISRQGAYNLLNSHDFPTLKVGRRLMVPKSKLINWIDEKSAVN